LEEACAPWAKALMVVEAGVDAGHGTLQPKHENATWAPCAVSSSSTHAWRNVRACECLEERSSLRVLPKGSFAWRNIYVPEGSFCLEEHLCSERFLLPGGTFMFRKVPFGWRNIYAWRNSLECLEERMRNEYFRKDP
jgi:hypothetical protein